MKDERSVRFTAVRCNNFRALWTGFAAVLTVAASIGASPASDAGLPNAPLKLVSSGQTWVLLGVIADDYSRLSGTNLMSQDNARLGEGIDLLAKEKVDLVACDLPMNSTYPETKAVNRPVVQIPVAGQTICVRYNLPGVRSLNLTGSLLADIYLGRIERWDDPRIKAINRSARLPSQPMHRFTSPGSACPRPYSLSTCIR